MQNDLQVNSKMTNGKKTKDFRQKLYSQRYLLAMAIPGVIWMLIFNYIPMAGIVIAFKQYNIVKPISAAPWVGFMHFTEFFADDNFWLIMKNTIGISFFKLIIGFPLPIMFALLLNEITSVRFKKSVQTISYLPHFLSWVVLGGILMNWLSDVGIINNILIGIGLSAERINYLAKAEYFWGIAVVSDIWKELGWSAIIYLAAIAGIDPEMYEAATIDGAGRFRRMFSITLPSITPTISILFILAISGLLNANFDQILVLKNSLNISSSNVVDIYVYTMGIQNARFSYATAVGLFKSVIAFILLFSANLGSKKLNGTGIF